MAEQGHALRMRDTDENARLLGAMTTLARRRDEASRKAMYMALLQATLYVPVEPDPNAPEQTRLAEDEPLHGRPVYAVFTSMVALSKWRPQSAAHTTMKGTELFPVLAGSDVGSCLINPKGEVRGEVYRHEVEMLAAAVPKLQAWRTGQTEE